MVSIRYSFAKPGWRAVLARPFPRRRSVQVGLQLLMGGMSAEVIE